MTVLRIVFVLRAWVVEFKFYFGGTWLNLESEHVVSGSWYKKWFIGSLKISLFLIEWLNVEYVFNKLFANLYIFKDIMIVCTWFLILD